MEERAVKGHYLPWNATTIAWFTRWCDSRAWQSLNKCDLDEGCRAMPVNQKYYCFTVLLIKISFVLNHFISIKQKRKRIWIGSFFIFGELSFSGNFVFRDLSFSRNWISSSGDFPVRRSKMWLNLKLIFRGKGWKIF